MRQLASLVARKQAPNSAAKPPGVRPGMAASGASDAQSLKLPRSGRSPRSPAIAQKRSRPVSRVLCASRRDSHSSRRRIAAPLKRPTREQRGQRYRSPIRSCSRWGLPCRLVAQLAVRSCRTVSPLPRMSCDTVRRSALCCTFRRLAPPRRYLAPCPAEPGLSSTLARRDCPADSVDDCISYVVSAFVQSLAWRAADRCGQFCGLRRRQFLAQQCVDATAFHHLVIDRLACAGDHQHEFAALLIAVFAQSRADRFQRIAERGFVQLGEFTEQARFALRAERVAQVFTTIADAMGGLVEHQRARLVRQLAQPRATRGCFRRQKPFERSEEHTSEL